MITWLEEPYKGTNKETGFEVLIHALYLDVHFGLSALCVDEEGVLHTVPISSGALALDWRFVRGKGWKLLDDVGELGD